MASEKELKARIRAVEKPFRSALADLENALDKFAKDLGVYLRGGKSIERRPPPEPGAIVVIRVAYAPIEEDQQRWRFTSFEPETGAAQVDDIIDALTRIRYEDDEIANRATILPGCVGVPEPFLASAQRINALKDRLAEVIKALRPEGGRVMVRFTDTKTLKVNQRDITAALLHRAGETDLNLKAAYRHIPVVRDPVQRIRFMHLQNRTVKSYTVAALIDRVKDFTDSDQKRDDLAFLAKLNEDEVLSVASRTYERVGMKVRLHNASERTTDVRKVSKRSFEMPGELPLLYPYTPQTGSLPDVIAPKFKAQSDRTNKPRAPSKQNRQGTKRARSVLATTPCLKTIPRCYRREFDPDTANNS